MHLRPFICLLLGLLTFGYPKANAEIYLECYSGAVFGCSKLSPPHINTKNTFGVDGLNGSFSNHTSKNLIPSWVGGVKIGAWMNPDLERKCCLPCGIDHFGMYIDLSYHSLDYNHHKRTSRISYSDTSLSPPLGPAVDNGKTRLFIQGHATTLAFMLAYRHGFFPCGLIPFGRLQPYVAIGPGVLFVDQKVRIGPHEADDTNFSVFVAKNATLKKWNTKAVPCFAVDTGLRLICSCRVSLDLFFKYRYAAPTFKFSSANGRHGSSALKPNYNLCSINLGAVYHF